MNMSDPRFTSTAYELLDLLETAEDLEQLSTKPRGARRLVADAAHKWLDSADGVLAMAIHQWAMGGSWEDLEDGIEMYLDTQLTPTHEVGGRLVAYADGRSFVMINASWTPRDLTGCDVRPLPPEPEEPLTGCQGPGCQDQGCPAHYAG